MIKKIILSMIRGLGFEIHKKRNPSSQVTSNQMNLALERFRRLNYEIHSIVDVGAAQGHWSLMTKSIFPDANYVLFEPLTERKEELESLVKSNRKFHYIPKAAGKENGKVSFGISADLDGSGVTFDPKHSNSREIEVASIQNVVSGLNLKGPFVVKLDTHGFEVPILDGCETIMSEIKLFIIECYGFQIVKDSLLFWEMCERMNQLGFRVFDIVDVIHRQRDEAFWQCDIFFIPKANPLFLHNKYL